MNSRIGQWKLTDHGLVKCIAEGDGYVMFRSKGRFPLVMESLLWDEHYDGIPSADFELIPHPAHNENH